MATKTRSGDKAGSSPKILIASGVNLDLLGRREPEVYGRFTLADIERELTAKAPVLAELAGFRGCDLVFFQTNHEADYLEMLDKGWDGALLNPGAWTHTSLALADRLAGLGLIFMEVHLSNIAARESFRHHSYSAPFAAGVVYGLGVSSYVAGLCGLLHKLAATQTNS